MILVIGATGMVGSKICHQLTIKGQSVKAMIRATSDPVKRKKLEYLGVQTLQGDLRDSSTFDQALEGITAVITTVSSMPFCYLPGENDIRNVDLDGMKSFIDHARTAGVKRFIYTSFSGNIDLDFPLRNAKRAIEQHLRESGINYTILRPSYFMEAWLTAIVGFDIDQAKVQIFGDGSKTVSYISNKDVATFAVESLTNVNARNATLELGGPDKVSQLQAVKIFEKITRKKFEIEHLPKETLESRMKTATDPMQQSFSGLMTCVANGDPIDMKETLRKFHVKLTSVKEYAKQLVAVN
jgi:uncharacterized protein YbjT (DUF2867 family)